MNIQKLDWKLKNSIENSKNSIENSKNSILKPKNSIYRGFRGPVWPKNVLKKNQLKTKTLDWKLKKLDWKLKKLDFKPQKFDLPGISWTGLAQKYAQKSLHCKCFAITFYTFYMWSFFSTHYAVTFCIKKCK